MLREREKQALGLASEPSPYIIRKMNDAILFHADYRDFDNALPYEGGLWDQPAGWTIPVRCIMRAEAQADRERREEKRKKDNPDGGEGVRFME